MKVSLALFAYVLCCSLFLLPSANGDSKDGGGGGSSDGDSSIILGVGVIGGLAAIALGAIGLLTGGTLFVNDQAKCSGDGSTSCPQTFPVTLFLKGEYRAICRNGGTECVTAFQEGWYSLMGDTYDCGCCTTPNQPDYC